MNRPVTIKIVRDGMLVATSMSTKWAVSMDSLSPNTSTFELVVEQRKAQIGDTIIVEQMGDPYGFHYIQPKLVVNGGNLTYNNVVIPFYIGKITAYDLLTVTAKDLITALHDQKVVERTWEGSHPSEYLQWLMTNYISVLGNRITAPTYMVSTKEPVTTNSKAWKRVIQQASSKNMTDIMSDIQKYYQTIATCAGYTVESSTRKISFHIVYHNILNDLYSTNTVNPIVLDLDNKKKYPEESIDIFVQPVAVTGTNCVNLIQNGKPETIDKSSPIHVYMENSGALTLTPNVANLRMPLKIETVVFEPHEDPKHVWTPEEYKNMASPSMSKDSYAHTVKFDCVLDNFTKIPQAYSTIGQPVRVFHKQMKLDSYITGWSMSSTSEVISITCGNIRTNLPLYIRYATNK